KSDGLDVRKLLSMLMRYAYGEREVWRVVHVPSVAAEDGRHLHRDLATLKQERASTTARIKGLLRSQGRRLTSLSKCPEPLEALRRWDGSEMPRGLRQRLLRVWRYHAFLRQQLSELAAERRALLDSSKAASSEQVRQCRSLKGIGSNGSGVWVMEFFGWRECKNRREGGLSGLHADTVATRRECPRTMPHQVRASACALDDHGGGVAL